MEFKVAFLVLIPLFATCESQRSEDTHYTSSGARYNQGNIPNSALRPWGTVPSPFKNNGNPTVGTTFSPLRPLPTGTTLSPLRPLPTSNTLSPLRPFGTVPPPRGSNPQNRPQYPNPTPYPMHPYSYRSPVTSDPGVTLPPLRSHERQGGSSPSLYPSLAYFNRNGNLGRGEEITTLPSAVVNGNNYN